MSNGEEKDITNKIIGWGGLVFGIITSTATASYIAVNVIVGGHVETQKEINNSIKKEIAEVKEAVKENETQIRVLTEKVYAELRDARERQTDTIISITKLTEAVKSIKEHKDK